MGQPTRSTVNSWDVSTLRTQATGLIAAAATLREQTQAVVDAAQGAGNWHGESQRACEERALSDQTEINKLGSDVDRAGNILNNTANAIEPNRTTALSRCNGLEHDGFAVADDWTVTETRDYATAIANEEEGSDTYNNLVTMRDGRANDAINATLSLKALADQMGIDDQAGADALANAFGNAEINAPMTSGLSRQQAARDVEAISNGTATPQQKARFEAATDLPPEQRDALIQGRDAVISKGQFEYLQGIYAKLGEGGLAAFTKFGGDDPALKSALADGLQILSNPNVRTDQQIENSLAPVFNSQFGLPTIPSYIQGGLSQLPNAIRDPLTHQAVKNDHALDTRATIVRESLDFPTLEGLGQIADILNHGDPNNQLGSDIDRALIVRSSEIAGATSDWDGPFGTVQDPIDIDTIKEVLNKTTSVAGNDHIAVHDALLTGREHGASPTSSMPDTIGADGKSTAYDANVAMKNLLTFDWPDDEPGSEKNLGITRLFDWIGQDADASGHQGELAGEAAEGLAHILIANETELGGFLPDDGDFLTYQSLGEVNPGLTQALATTLSPYLPNFVDVPNDITVNQHAGELDTVTDLSKLFKVLDSDPTSAGIINTAGAQWQNHLAYQFGLHPDQASLGTAAGQLDEAMTRGMQDEMEVLTTNQQWDNIVAYNRDSATYDTIYAALGAVLPDEVTGPLSVLNPGMKFDMIDIPNDPKGLADNPIKLTDIKTESLTDPTIRSHAALQANAIDNEAARQFFTYTDENTGEVKSFFLDTGQLDWDAVAKYDDEFSNKYTLYSLENPSDGLTQFEVNYNSGHGEDTIDHTSIPTPADPSKPPTLPDP